MIQNVPLQCEDCVWPLMLRKRDYLGKQQLSREPLLELLVNKSVITAHARGQDEQMVFHQTIRNSRRIRCGR